MEEELFEMEKIVKTRIEYNDFLKKKIRGNPAQKTLVIIL